MSEKLTRSRTANFIQMITLDKSGLLHKCSLIFLSPYDICVYIYYTCTKWHYILIAWIDVLVIVMIIYAVNALKFYLFYNIYYFIWFYIQCICLHGLLAANFFFIKASIKELYGGVVNSSSDRDPYKAFINVITASGWPCIVSDCQL